jgi:hypothetical protein
MIIRYFATVCVGCWRAEYDLKVIGEAGDGAEAVKRLRQTAAGTLSGIFLAPDHGWIDVENLRPDRAITHLASHLGSTFLGNANPQARRSRVYQMQRFHSPLPVSRCHFPPFFSSALNSPPLHPSPQ